MRRKAEPFHLPSCISGYQGISSSVCKLGSDLGCCFYQMAGQHCWWKTFYSSLSLRKQRDREVQWVYIQRRKPKVSFHKEKHIKANITLPHSLRDLRTLSIFSKKLTPSLLSTCLLHGSIIYITTLAPFTIQEYFKSHFRKLSD